MDTRKIASEYRLKHWTEVKQERQALGVSIRSYCKSVGISECVYYYWQRRVRASALEVAKMQEQRQEKIYEQPSSPPAGWALCTITDSESTAESYPASSLPMDKPLYIEIGKSRIEVMSDTDKELLTQVCRMLVSLC